MAGLLLIVLAVVLLIFWIKALVEYDGSEPDFCKDCNPKICPFPCEKHKR